MENNVSANIEHQKIRLEESRRFIDNLINIFNEAEGDSRKLAVDIEIFLKSEKHKAHDLANQIQLLIAAKYDDTVGD